MGIHINTKCGSAPDFVISPKHQKQHKICLASSETLEKNELSEMGLIVGASKHKSKHFLTPQLHRQK